MACSCNSSGSCSCASAGTCKCEQGCACSNCPVSCVSLAPYPFLAPIAPMTIYTPIAC